MDYLDYLADFPYDDLPEAIRTTVSREDYSERRQMVLAMREPEETALPPALAAAFMAATPTSDLARTQVQKEGRRRKVRWLPWLAAAGWLLFLGVSSLLLLQEPAIQLVEKTIIAPAPAPKIIHTTDTLYQTVTAYKYRTKTVHDTLYEKMPFEQLVYVRDTIYLPRESQALLAKGSSNLLGKERMLSFLIGAE
ncbi:hypothetical protein [Neolewinella persica]|uniref:hypothetical protein n=1 Tax=Neolewinella persica TaxID=70998 RepID=UPI0003790952|nr:hypothetical protein [Neolewinella persica]